jgi:hypothetical protein
MWLQRLDLQLRKDFSGGFWISESKVKDTLFGLLSKYLTQGGLRIE